jgi:hypothetical protein
MTTAEETFQAYAEMREMEDLEMMVTSIAAARYPQLYRVFVSTKQGEGYAIMLAFSMEEALTQVESRYPEMVEYWYQRQAELTPEYLAKFPSTNPIARHAEAVGNFTAVWL